MQRLILLIGFLCALSYANVDELIETHKKTFPKFLAYAQESGENFGPVVTVILARQLFDIKPKDEKPIEFLQHYFSEKNKEKREQSIDSFLDNEKNRAYIKTSIPKLTKEKKLVRRISLNELSPVLKRKTEERVKLDSDHEEYFDCITCNLFAIHLMIECNPPLDADKDTNA